VHTLSMLSGPLSSSRPRRLGARVLGLALVGSLALSGCSDATTGDDPSAAGSTSSSASESPSGSATPSESASSSASTEATPYLPVRDGVDLTAQGSELAVGDHAVVAFEPRQDEVGVLDIKVTRLEKTTFEKSFSGWQLDATTRKSNPYFVHATVQNVGGTDLGGRKVPLYIVDGRNTLIEASDFASTFRPCPSKPLPRGFENGDRTKVCLVYLSPRDGELTAVSFRPTEDFNPIIWTGEVQPLGSDKATKDRKKKSRKANS
jgi:hypothetical protein